MREIKPGRLISLACALLTVACSAEPIRTVPSHNTNVKVAIIAEFDGVILYRVQDGDSQTVYVAVSGARTRVEWLEQQDKNTVERETQTIER